MCISELLKALCALKINNNYTDMNYSKLVAAIDDRIKANGRREITGQTLHDVLEAMVRSLGAGYQVAGVLGVDDDPGTPDQRFAWLAAEPGVYRNCGGLAVTELSWIIWGGEWILKPMDVPFGVSVKEWIREAVAEERSRAMIAEALLQEHIDQEAAMRADADTALGGRIDKEIADRTQAVADEAAAREAADTALGKRIDKEISDREAAVAAEADARTKADAALQANIDKEQERAEGAESALRTDLDTEVTERKQAVADEAAARTDADTALGKRIDTETAERKAADTAETEARTAADAAEKAAREKAVADEQARAEKAEQANAAAIAKEAEDRAAAVTAEAKARADADTALGKRVDTEIADRKAAVTAEETARKSADSELDTRVTAIEGKIPATASASNKLADTDFVNSSISTATATFRGTFDTLEALKATEADKNDYAFYVHKDEAGNTCYDKYTYDGAEWKFEYRLNNSSFTAAQWAAINSGITAEVIKALQDADKANSDAIAKETTDRKSADSTLQTNIDTETSTRESADTALGERIDTEIADRKAADTSLLNGITNLVPRDIIYDGTRFAADGGFRTIVATLQRGVPVFILSQGDSPFGDCTLNVVGFKFNGESALDGILTLYAGLPASWSNPASGTKDIIFVWTEMGGGVEVQDYNPQTAIDGKQDKLVSGTNIKTVNGTSLLGEDDITISSGKGKSGSGNLSEVFNVGDNYSPTDANSNQATGACSHSEGYKTKAEGTYSHSEGYLTIAGGEASHSEGYYNAIYYYNGDADSGQANHIEGSLNKVYLSGPNNSGSHIEGYHNQFNSGFGNLDRFTRGCHIGGHCAKRQAGGGTLLRIIGAGTESIPKNALVIAESNYKGTSVTTESTAKLYVQDVGGYTGKEDSLSGVQDLATVINGKAKVLVGNATITDGKKMSLEVTVWDSSGQADPTVIITNEIKLGTQFVAVYNDTTNNQSAIYQLSASVIKSASSSSIVFGALLSTGWAIGKVGNIASPSQGYSKLIIIDIDFDKDLY